MQCLVCVVCLGAVCVLCDSLCRVGNVSRAHPRAWEPVNDTACAWRRGVHHDRVGALKVGVTIHSLGIGHHLVPGGASKRRVNVGARAEQSVPAPVTYFWPSTRLSPVLVAVLLLLQLESMAPPMELSPLMLQEAESLSRPNFHSRAPQLTLAEAAMYTLSL